MTKLFTKESLIQEFRDLAQRGWIPSTRIGNTGDVGNTLEDYLQIAENNLPIPNAAEWELKSRSTRSSALITLCHVEPSPRALRFIPQIILPNFGWSHTSAGINYPAGERRISLTISGHAPSDRGFMVKVNRAEQKIEIDFDASKVALRHSEWLEQVKSRLGPIPRLDPIPYWGFDDLYIKVGSKLRNCFLAEAQKKTIAGIPHYWYRKVTMLSAFKLENLLNLLEAGYVYVDIDARTGHNHGTKFRVSPPQFSRLYEDSTVVVEV